MKYKAVIFDLFGTLLDNDERMLRRMAAVLLISPSDFIQLWHSALKGQTSEHISDEKVILDICQNVRNKKCTKKELQAAL